MEKENKYVPETRTGRLRNYLSGGTVVADIKKDLGELKTNLGMLGLDLDNTKSRLRRGGGYRWPVREAAPVFAATAGIVVYLAGAEEVEAQPGACEHLTPYGYSPVQNGQPGMECFENTLDGIQGNEVKVAYYPPIPTPEPGILSTPVPPSLPTVEIPQIVIPTLDIPTITIPTPAPLPTYAPLPTVDWSGLFDPSATDVPVATVPPVDWEDTPIGEYSDEIFIGSAAAVVLSVVGGALLAILTRPRTSGNFSQGQSESEPGLSNDGRTPRSMRPPSNVPSGSPVRQSESRVDRSGSGERVHGHDRGGHQASSTTTRNWTLDEISEHDARVDATINELERKYGFRPKGTRGSRGGKGR